MLRPIAFVIAILGASLLMACAVEDPASPTDEAELTAALTAELAEVPQELQLVQPMEACTYVPGAEPQFCCPYSLCTCPGERVCQPSGQWSRCLGATRFPLPCN